jgi:hypothetical protein
MKIEYNDATVYGDAITVIEARANGNEYALTYTATSGKWRVSLRLPRRDVDLMTRHRLWPERYETLEAAKRGLEEVVDGRE